MPTATVRKKGTTRTSISGVFKGLEPGNFYFRNMPWLKQHEHPISKKIAEEARDGEFTIFNKVMEAAVKKGMSPLRPKDIGVFVSWMIKNLPVKHYTETDAAHQPLYRNLGVWHMALNKELPKDMPADRRIKFARHYLRYIDHIASGGDEREAAGKFVDDVGPEDARRIIEAPLSPAYDTFDGRAFLKTFSKRTGHEIFVFDRAALERHHGGDKALLTEEGLAEAKRQGWHDDDRSYVIHVDSHMKMTPDQHWALFKGDVLDHVRARTKAESAVV